MGKQDLNAPCPSPDLASKKQEALNYHTGSAPLGLEWGVDPPPRGTCPQQLSFLSLTWRGDCLTTQRGAVPLPGQGLGGPHLAETAHKEVACVPRAWLQPLAQRPGCWQSPRKGTCTSTREWAGAPRSPSRGLLGLRARRARRPDPDGFCHLLLPTGFPPTQGGGTCEDPRGPLGIAGLSWGGSEDWFPTVPLTRGPHLLAAPHPALSPLLAGLWPCPQPLHLT